MSLKTVDKGWEPDGHRYLVLIVLAMMAGIGALVAITWFAMRADTRGVPTTDVQPMKKIQREDDPVRGVSCYWIYTGSGGGVALSCVALAADGGAR